MIIGSGSIARLLNDRNGFLFFAAGVSDSSIEVDRSPDIHREFESLIDASNLDFMFVYFSSISVFTTKSRYTAHKLAAENFIKTNFENYTIIRLGNIWECTNPHTFINAYKNMPYKLRDEYKYMISKEQLNFITDNLPKTGKHEISVFGEALKVEECLKR